MIYLTKQQLIDRIKVWIEYDVYTEKIFDLMESAQTPDKIADLEWMYRNDLLTAIILKEMEITDLEHARAMTDQIESFEMYCEFDQIVHTAIKENHNAEWVYNEFVKQWYNILQDAIDQASYEDEAQDNE